MLEVFDHKIGAEFFLLACVSETQVEIRFYVYHGIAYGKLLLSR